ALMSQISPLGDMGSSVWMMGSERTLEVNGIPTVKDSQSICDLVYSLFVSEAVDKVELLYSKFVSLVRSDPIIQTLLPMSPKGEIC
ncbi:hypothetical protein L9G15_25010, partial [Shewanella sp. A3A]|nr:hypothetical protein [Shewanella ferrihydritica]